MGQCLTCQATISATISGAPQKCDRCAAASTGSPHRLPTLLPLSDGGEGSGDKTLVSHSAPRPPAVPLLAPPVFTPPPQLNMTLVGSPALTLSPVAPRPLDEEIEQAKTVPLFGEPISLGGFSPSTSPFVSPSPAVVSRPTAPALAPLTNPFASPLSASRTPLPHLSKMSPQETMPGRNASDDLRGDVSEGSSEDLSEDSPPSLSELDDDLPLGAEDSFSSHASDFTEILDEIKSIDMSVDESGEHTIDIEPEELYSDLEAQDELTPPPRVAAPPPLPTPPPAAPPAAPPARALSGGRLFVLSGSPQALPLHQSLSVGSRLSSELFSDLNADHFRLTIEAGRVWVEPTGGSELWLRARRMALRVNQECRIGQTRLRLARRAGLISPSAAAGLSGLTEGLSLLIINGQGGLDGVFNLPQGVTRVGRALADLALKDPSVSLRHLALRVEGERVEVIDLESEGGVWVRVLERTALSPSDLLSAGHTLFAARA